jgi:hypothetical protein
VTTEWFIIAVLIGIIIGLVMGVALSRPVIHS